MKKIGLTESVEKIIGEEDEKDFTVNSHLKLKDTKKLSNYTGSYAQKCGYINNIYLVAGQIAKLYAFYRKDHLSKIKVPNDLFKFIEDDPDWSFITEAINLAHATDQEIQLGINLSKVLRGYIFDINLLSKQEAYDWIVVYAAQWGYSDEYDFDWVMREECSKIKSRYGKDFVDSAVQEGYAIDKGIIK